jgi:hypothetical protein
MISDNPNRKPAIAAAIAASLLMLVFGLTYRVLAARMPPPTSNSPLDPDALEGFLMQIGGWKGQDVPLDEAVLREIGADASINRLYSRGSGSESVSLFVAASGATVGTLVGHPPEICNVWSGHKLTYNRSTELLLDDGTKLPCRILQFSRAGGSLDVEKRTVLCYYMADGQFCGDRSLLRSRVRRGSGVTCVAQIQIVASAGIATADSTTELATAFAVDSASSIVQLFKDIEKNRSSGQIREMPKGK